MRLKPKTTVKSVRALLYRRFTDIQKSYQSVAYQTQDGKLWIFDPERLFFEIQTAAKTIPVENEVSVLKYGDKYYYYKDFQWQETQLASTSVLLSEMFQNITRYQTNAYYYSGSFDFIIHGDIEGSTTQYLKGNIIPLKSFNIKHFNDQVKLSPDDLVVVDGHLYSVENPTVSYKLQPRRYAIYYATLNNIL